MPARRHTRDEVIRSALGVLDDKGVEAVSVREVARRMRVNVNTVSFQVGTKAALLELMASTVLAGMSLEALPDDGIERTKEVLRRCRRALLTHRDGARLVAGTAPMEDSTLRMAEAITTALVESGVSDSESVRATWGLFYFMLGLTQDEQAGPEDGPKALEEAVATGDFPTLRRLGRGLVDISFDERFEFGLDAILEAVHPSTRCAGTGSDSR